MEFVCWMLTKYLSNHDGLKSGWTFFYNVLRDVGNPKDLVYFNLACKLELRLNWNHLKVNGFPLDGVPIVSRHRLRRDLDFTLEAYWKEL